MHRRQQRRRAEVVVCGVCRQVGHRDPGPHHRGLVTDDIDATEQRAPFVRTRTLADIELVGARRSAGLAVGHREHEVHPHDLVAGRVELPGDLAADEAGRSGQQDLHGIPGMS